MAPGKKRGRSSSSSSAQEWNVGDLVLAKVKGFPAWPAQVSKPEAFGHPQQPTRVFVVFFGTRQIRFCHHSEISRFTPEAKATLVAKAHSKCTGADLRLAVSEICEVAEKSSGSGDTLLLAGINGRSSSVEFNVIEDGEADAVNSEDIRNSDDGGVSGYEEPECNGAVDSYKDGEDELGMKEEEEEAGNGGAASDIEDADLGWGSPDSGGCSLDGNLDDEGNGKGIVIPEKVLTNFASHEELDTFDSFDFYNEEVVNVPEKKEKTPKGRNWSKQSSRTPAKGKKLAATFTPVIPVNVCRRKRKQVTVKASLPQPVPKYDNSDEVHNEPPAGNSAEGEADEFTFRRKVTLTKRARPSDLEIRSSEAVFGEKVDSTLEASPITHDPDSNLPIVKRARARSTEAMFRVDKEPEGRQGGSPSPTPASAGACPSDGLEYAKVEEKPSEDWEKPTEVTAVKTGGLVVEGLLPPKAEKYRKRSILADSEAVLPPSKRRYRAFEAMTACAAEAAAEEQTTRDAGETPATVADAVTQHSGDHGGVAEYLNKEKEVLKPCVADDADKLQELANSKEYIDKEVDPVSVHVSSEGHPQVLDVAFPRSPSLEPGEVAETLLEGTKIEDDSQSPEGTKNNGMLPDSPAVVSEMRDGEMSEDKIEKEAFRDATSAEPSEEALSPVSGNIEPVVHVEAQVVLEQTCTTVQSENADGRSSFSPELSPVSMDVSEDNSENRADAELEGQSDLTTCKVEEQAVAASCEVQDSVVQMELRPSLYKFRRRQADARVSKDLETERHLVQGERLHMLASSPPASYGAADVRQEATDVRRSRSGSSPFSRYSPVSPTDAAKQFCASRRSSREAVSTKIDKAIKSEDLPSPGMKATHPKSQAEKGRISRARRHSPPVHGSRNGDASLERGATDSRSTESFGSESDHTSGRTKVEITSRTKVVSAVDNTLASSTLRHTEGEVNKVRKAYEAAKELKQKLASKEGDTSSSTKYLMAAFDSKQIPGSMLFSSTEIGTEAEAGNKDGSLLPPGNTDAEAARDVFKSLLDVLSRAKESIVRATRQAIDCAKLGLSEQVIDIIAKRLETEQSFPRRIDLFFLVDSITQSSYSLKGTPAGVYRSIVQNALPRLLSAAAPPGSFARENRRQCLKVFKLWSERGVFPPPVIRHFMHEIELHNCDRMVMMSRRPARNERPVDDPIREIEGMQVDEYGSNASFSLPGLNIPRMFDEEEEGNDGAKTGSGVGEDDPAVNSTPQEPVERHARVLEDVDGELEMEDVSPDNGAWQRQYVSPSSILSGPPLPVCPPPTPPPLPASPPPNSSPPPPPLSPPPPPLDPAAYSYHQQQDGYQQDGGFSPSAAAYHTHVQNSSQQHGYNNRACEPYEQYNPGVYDDGYGMRMDQSGYNSYGYPDMPAPAPVSPQYQHHQQQYGHGYQQQHHHQHHHQSEHYGPPPHEPWPEPSPRGSRYHKLHNDEYYNEPSYNDRYGEQGGGPPDYYHHHHHNHQNGPPPSHHYNHHYEGSGRYPTPERHSRRRHYSHDGGGYHQHESYEYPEYSSRHESGYGGHEYEGGYGGGHEGGGGGGGGGGYHQQDSHGGSYSHGYSRW